eukprot:TRINITY_DN47172_c0_g1_i1.p1 TRINITY_DN47172_c0_g1~~TRINITY_DN47172_c0_g1_i1.p1  ORF type:complete len:508 (+),score=75.10 TRINITY_DN47172_c0_g1_i1:51-1526(+)
MASQVLAMRRPRSRAGRAFAVAGLSVATFTLVPLSFIARPASSSSSSEHLRSNPASSFGAHPPAILGAMGEAPNAPESAWAAFQKAGAGLLAGLAAFCIAWTGVPAEPEQSWLSGPAPAMARGKPGALTGSGKRPNKDPISLLQLALPLEDELGDDAVGPVRELQTSIEKVLAYVRIREYDKAPEAVDKLANLLSNLKTKLLKPIVPERQEKAQAILAEIESLVPKTQKNLIRDSRKSDDEKMDAPGSANQLQALVGQFEELMVPPSYFPKGLPKSASGLPLLNGRAVVEWTVKRDPNGEGDKKYFLDSQIADKAVFRTICDGWSAPISAGNFVDLVQRGFYNGLTIQRADGFIVQTGDPGAASENGFKPAPDKPVRRIPLEVALRGQTPLYSQTIDEARKLNTPPRIPFQADGTIAMARKEFEFDSASSQVFLFLFEPDMTPAGKNMMDGRYGNFGYTTDGVGFLRKLAVGDIIESVKVISGAENMTTAP